MKRTPLLFLSISAACCIQASDFTSLRENVLAPQHTTEATEAAASATTNLTSPLLTDESEVIYRDDVLEVLTTVNDTWQARNRRHGDYFWNRAVYHIGNMEAYAVTGNQQYLDYSTAWAERSNYWGATGTDKEAWQYKTYGEGSNWVLFGDNQVCFQVYIDLYHAYEEQDATMIQRALEVMGYEISTSETDYIWWVDGLFMVMPIMTKLYHITGDATYLEKMYEYWQYATSIMYDEETGLYFRDARYVYPDHTTYAGKKDFWARGDGWLFAAFAKVLADLPTDDSHREEYITYYRRMASALKQCQQEEGYWTRSLLDPDQAPGYETSGTALYTYGYAWGIRNGILDETEYGTTLERAWNYLSTVALQSDGTVGYIQPIGENASPWTTIKATDYHDFGVGAYLLAAAEVSRWAVDDPRPSKLRLNDVALDPTDAHKLIVRFNQPPATDEATGPSHYFLDEIEVNADGITIEENIVTIHLTDSLDYGLYHFSVEDLHSAEGGVLAEDQYRTLLRTVPLDAPQTELVVTAIGSQEGNPHTNVIDGLLSTRWSQEGWEQWICFELNETREVCAVDVAFYNGNSRIFYFKVQTSLDGESWDDVSDDLVSSGMTNELERYKVLPSEARFVRLLCSGNSTNRWNSPTEVRIRYSELDGITASSTRNASALPYDLQGRHLPKTPMKSGIYIINGRKIILQ